VDRRLSELFIQTGRFGVLIKYKRRLPAVIKRGQKKVGGGPAKTRATSSHCPGAEKDANNYARVKKEEKGGKNRGQPRGRNAKHEKKSPVTETYS